MREFYHRSSHGRRLARRVVCAVAGFSVFAGAIASASAEECDFPFPINDAVGDNFCERGTAKAEVAFELINSNPPFYVLQVDMQGGTLGAVAYGIDENGTNLTACNQLAADRDFRLGEHLDVPCNQLIGGTDETPVTFAAAYQHPFDMVATHVSVL